MRQLHILLIISFLVISGCGIAVYFLSSFVRAQSINYEIVGYAWSDKFGWISLSHTNCLNATSGACAGSGVQYGVRIDGVGVLSGYGWSEHVGWVCFGDTCSGTGGTVPGGGAPIASVDSVSGKITGWAKVVSLGNDGWIKLGRGAGQGSASGQVGQDCYDCREVCTPVFDENGEQISQTCDLQCNACFLKTCFQTDLNNVTDASSNCSVAHQLPSNVAGDDPVSGGSDLICSGFKQCRKIDVVVGEQTLSRIQCDDGSASVCEAYGVNRSNADGALLGWGWNGNNDGGVTGAGWVKFHGGDARIVYPWLQTQYGSIYVQPGGTIKQQTGTAGKNATYCIFADSVVNVTSADCVRLVKDVALGFPTSSQDQVVYRNALGKIDVQGLVTKLSGQQRNKYGNIVLTLGPDDEYTVGGGAAALNNAVIHFTESVTISDVITFQNGDAGQAGNGLIVVDGDLIIDRDMAYEQNAAVSDLRQLASVAWVVKGDVIINPNVRNIVGAFIVLGNGVMCAPADASEYPQYVRNGCGVFYSVDPAATDSGQQLSVLGLVIAKAFDFRRTFTDALIGSENIIYDGRLIANPPPGLKGFTEGLPVIRDF